MTRTRRQAAVAALAPALLGAVLLAGVAACGDDDSDQSRDDPTTAAPSTDASDPTQSATESTSAPETPSVAPATGIELVQATSAVRVPAGWEPQDALLDYASAAAEPGKLNTIQLADSGSISGGASLDALAQGAIKASRAAPTSSGSPTSTWAASRRSTSTTRCRRTPRSTTSSPPSATVATSASTSCSRRRTPRPTRTSSPRFWPRSAGRLDGRHRRRPLGSHPTPRVTDRSAGLPGD